MVDCLMVPSSARAAQITLGHVHLYVSEGPRRNSKCCATLNSVLAVRCLENGILRNVHFLLLSVHAIGFSFLPPIQKVQHFRVDSETHYKIMGFTLQEQDINYYL